MLELIVTTFFIGSFLGMVIFVFQKIPILRALPEIEINKKERLLSRLKRKLLNFKPFKNFSYEIFLQKFLMKIRIITLKTDHKTFNWLNKLREKTQKKKIVKEDSYWEEIKKEIKK